MDTNYPAGSDTPEAPWNQPDEEPRWFTVKTPIGFSVKANSIEDVWDNIRLLNHKYQWLDIDEFEVTDEG